MADLRTWIARLRTRPPAVPIVRLTGVIGGPGLRASGLSLSSVNPALERAFKLRGAKAVALSINSPGGSPVQSALIAGRIRALAGEKKLPVVAFIEDVGASGGYWLALAADEIFADPSSIVGSIGVVHASFGFAEALGRLGIERRLYTAGAKKSMLDPFRPERAEDVERLNAILHELHQGFKATVRQRRGARLKGGDEELFEGQIWTGRGALEAGLIDGLGDLHAVLRERFGAKVKLPLISTAKPWWQRRLGLEAWPRTVVDAALDSLTERALWSRYGL
jgi:signal peptide peptidase SppA